MAGTDPRYNSARAIAGILTAQRMGLPASEEDQPLFFPLDDRGYGAGATDSNGAPWNYRTAGKTGPAPTGVKAICGIKELETPVDPTSAGDQHPTKLLLTFVPAEWAKVSNFATVRIYGLDYARGKMPKPGTLFTDTFTKVEVSTFDRKGTNT